MNEISVLKWSGFRRPLWGSLCERVVGLPLYRQVEPKDTYFAVKGPPATTARGQCRRPAVLLGPPEGTRSPLEDGSRLCPPGEAEQDQYLDQAHGPQTLDHSLLKPTVQSMIRAGHHGPRNQGTWPSDGDSRRPSSPTY